MAYSGPSSARKLARGSDLEGYETYIRLAFEADVEANDFDALIKYLREFAEKYPQVTIRVAQALLIEGD